jgi:hypothetical protein
MLEFLLALLAGILGALAVRTFEWLLDRAEIVTPLFAFLVSFGAAAGFSERVAPPPSSRSPFSSSRHRSNR